MTDDILGTFEHIDAALAGGTPVSRGAVPHFAPPEAEAAVRGVNTSEIPQTLGGLGELISYSYDLSVKQAGDLNIPVVGDVSGGFDRRVVVLEWTRYKTLFDADSVEYRYGYVIRFCLTVSKWEAQTQVRLPFLAAQAELGNIQASWLMQIRGLTGEKIDGVVLPPQELHVSTFAIAKQSLEAANGAVKDPTTKLSLNPPRHDRSAAPTSRTGGRRQTFALEPAAGQEPLRGHRPTGKLRPRGQRCDRRSVHLSWHHGSDGQTRRRCSRGRTADPARDQRRRVKR
jgi:hypothetical protein